MITFEEILHLPVFHNVVVQAGTAGLRADVRWVHIMDHKDVADFLEGGELLLTNGNAWPVERDVEEQPDGRPRPFGFGCSSS